MKQRNGDYLRNLKRRCLVCGKKIIIELNSDGAYSGGCYFGKLDVPDTKNWKRRVIGRSKIGNMDVKVVNSPPVKKIIEHWECKDCSIAD